MKKSNTASAADASLATKPTSRIGGSLLPSSEPRILLPMPAKHGTFQVRPLPDLDTYGLFLDGNLVAMHPNGYSCHNLAERVQVVWEGKRAAEYALAQFQFILSCGGLGISEGAMLYYINGLKHVEPEDTPQAAESQAAA